MTCAKCNGKGYNEDDEYVVCQQCLGEGLNANGEACALNPEDLNVVTVMLTMDADGSMGMRVSGAKEATQVLGMLSFARYNYLASMTEVITDVR